MERQFRRATLKACEWRALCWVVCVSARMFFHLADSRTASSCVNQSGNLSVFLSNFAKTSLLMLPYLVLVVVDGSSTSCDWPVDNVRTMYVVPATVLI